VRDDASACRLRAALPAVQGDIQTGIGFLSNKVGYQPQCKKRGVKARHSRTMRNVLALKRMLPLVQRVTARDPQAGVGGAGGAGGPGVRPYIPVPNFLRILSKLLRYPEIRVVF
jgi:hypothetical protein